MQAAEYTEPIHLTAFGNLQSGVEGGVNAKSLKNPLSTPIVIERIKFQLICESVPAEQVGRLNGSTVLARLALNGMALTNGPVPIWCLGPQKNLWSEQPAAFGLEFSTTPIGMVEFEWKLDHPLLLRAGELIEPKLTQGGLIKQSVECRISYAGRTATKAEAAAKKGRVPYASAYLSKAFNAFGDEDTDQSKDTDLQNPFQVPLQVKRLVGRVSVFDDSNGTSDTDLANIDFSQRYLTMRMSASDGSQLIRNFAIFRQCFHIGTRAWECPHIMEPGLFYSAYLEKAAPSVTQSSEMRAQAFVSLVGSREEAL